MQVRADLNVPLSKSRTVEDDTRIKEAVPTLRYLLERGAKVLLCSHLVSPEIALDCYPSMRFSLTKWITDARLTHLSFWGAPSDATSLRVLLRLQPERFDIQSTLAGTPQERCRSRIQPIGSYKAVGGLSEGQGRDPKFTVSFFAHQSWSNICEQQYNAQDSNKKYADMKSSKISLKLCRCSLPRTVSGERCNKSLLSLKMAKWGFPKTCHFWNPCILRRLLDCALYLS